MRQLREDGELLLAGTRILVVEDEVFLALELEEALSGEGAEVVGPSHTVPKRTHWLARKCSRPRCSTCRWAGIPSARSPRNYQTAGSLSSSIRAKATLRACTANGQGARLSGNRSRRKSWSQPWRDCSRTDMGLWGLRANDCQFGWEGRPLARSTCSGEPIVRR